MKYLFFMFFFSFVSLCFSQKIKHRSFANDTKKESGKDSSSLDTLDYDRLSVVDSVDIKADFKSKLESRFNSLDWDETSKQDLLEEVDQLQHSYRETEKYQQLIDEDPDFDSKLNAFGKEEVTEGWMNDRVASVQIFNENPSKELQDKQALKQQIVALQTLSDQKSAIIQDSEMDPSVLNSYHKYLKGQQDYQQFENSVKESEVYRSDKSRRKNHKKLLRDVKRLDTEEQKLKETIAGNEYLKSLSKDQEKGTNYLKKSEDASEWDEEQLYGELSEKLHEEDIHSLLGNDYLSAQVDELQPDIGKAGGEIVEQEALAALDSLEEKWKNEEVKSMKEPLRKRDKEEVEELLVKDTHVQSLIPDPVFFEGVVSFSPDFSAFSVSPNIGYAFENGLSVGFGVTLHHTQDTSAVIRTALDYKTFARYELFKGMFFVQAEYVAMFPGISYLDVNEGVGELQRTGFLIGGGATIKVKGKKLLGLGVMHNLNQNMGVPTYDSPLLVRLGIKPF